MVDYHTHLLPDMDDGVRSVEESLAALSALKRLGFRHVVLSPHFYTNREPADAFIARREDRYARIARAVDSGEGGSYPQLHLGAEVYLTSLLFNTADLRPLTVDGGDCMLTELPYDDKLKDSTLSNLERLCYSEGITPVLAHIERYPYLLDPSLLGELFDMGCRAQVNINPLSWGTKRKLKKLLSKGFVFALGTDTHIGGGLYDRVSKGLSSVNNALGTGYVKAAGAYTKENLI